MTGSTPGGVPEHPDDGAGWAGRLQRVALLRKMGQHDRAVEEAGRLCVDFPDSPQAHLELCAVKARLTRDALDIELAFPFYCLFPNKCGRGEEKAELLHGCQLCAQLQWTPCCRAQSLPADRRAPCL